MYMYLVSCINVFLFIVLDVPSVPDFAIVKIHILLLLSVIARHSEEGFEAIIEAFDHYKVLG